MGGLTRRRSVLLAIALLLVVSSIALFLNDRDSADHSSVVPEDDAPLRPRGGVVRVAVPTPPEMPDTSVGGATLRQLVLPSLFVAQPDGSWRASLIEPGTDRSAKDSMSADFRLRAGAKWSDGAPITVDDLRRTMDERFVASIDDPDPDGNVTVRFTRALPGWRRLWSGDDAIRPRNPDAYGGAYRVQSVASGLETVLVPNETWWGIERGAFLSEIRLVLVPDVIVARELLMSGSIDVVSPPADTVRSVRLQAFDRVNLSRSEDTNAWAMLRFNAERVSLEARRAIASAFPRDDFVDALLEGEATRLRGLTSDDVWPADLPTSTDPNRASFNADGSGVEFVLPSEQPLAPLLARALERAADKSGLDGNSRLADRGEIDQLLAKNEYDVVFEAINDGPDLCWICHFPARPDLARLADSGDRDAARELQRVLRDEALVIPLWRPASVAAFRSDVVDGVEANGYANGVAWNAERWWRPR